MRKLAAALFLLLAPALAAAQTAIRPDQISPGTPDITWGQVGAGYQIGSTVPWRQDATATPTFTCTTPSTSDNAKTVELTFNGPITSTLPAATGCFGDGAGFAIQTKTGTLTLTAPSGTTINGVPGTTGIAVGAYQNVTLLSKASNWYAVLSIPQPATVAGKVLSDNMTWITPTGTPPAGIALVQQGSDVTQNGSTLISPYTTTTSLLPVTAGNTVVVTIFLCQVSSVCTGTPTSAVISTITHTRGSACSSITGAKITSSNGFRVEMWFCPVTTTGTDTFTITVGGGTVYFPQFFGSEWSGLAASPDDGKGNTATGTGTAVSVATSAAVTQASELIISISANVVNSAATVGQTFIIADAGNSLPNWYQLSTAAAVQTNTATLASSTLWIAAVAALKHP